MKKLIEHHTMALVAFLACVANELQAETPLHQRIDASVLAKADGQTPALRIGDAEFLRRVFLDFSGSIPTATKTREFLADSSPEKRLRVIDELLAAPTYATRMENLLHVMLMERRGDDPEWSKFLRHSLTENKPWKDIAQRILDPNADDEATRGSAFFITKRLDKYGQNPTDFPGLTRDVGRLFLGLDLQCAECHDHLFIDDYKQVDFKGLFVAYGNSFIRTDVKFPAIGEKELVQKLEFVSVFDPTQKATGPRVPFGTEFVIPVSQTDPKKPRPKDAPPRPEFSPVRLIADAVTNSENKQFARNAVNRLWFVLAGRGIVHPLDLHHKANPPANPELLEMLTDEFVKHGFDVKWLLREIALTETYQRSTRADVLPVPAESKFLVGIERHLAAEQLLQSVLVATGETRLIDAEPQPTVEPKAAASPGGVADETKPDPNSAPTYAELKTKFVAAFANDAREPEIEVNSTVKGALFWRNEVDIQRLLVRRPGNLTDRLVVMDDATAVNEMFVSVLSRLPTDDESKLVGEFLAAQKDREIAMRDAAWALMSSAEFYTNH